MIRRGIKQGDTIAPVLFCIFFAVVLTRTFSLCPTNSGIAIRTREDGGVFNQARLRAKAKMQMILVFLLTQDLQDVMDCFSKACDEFGLIISVAKIKINQSQR